MSLKEEILNYFIEKKIPDARGASKKIYFDGEYAYSIDKYDKIKYGNYKTIIENIKSKYILKPIELTEDGQFIYAKWNKLEKVDHEWVEKQDISTIEENFKGLEQAVDQLHKKNLVWLDIKPNNMMREGKTIKLIDLDGANTGSATQKYIFCLNPCYRGDRGSIIQDKYALYVSFIELITGEDTNGCPTVELPTNALEKFESIYESYKNKIEGLFKDCNPQKSSQPNKNLYKIKF